MTHLPDRVPELLRSLLSFSGLPADAVLGGSLVQHFGDSFDSFVLNLQVGLSAEEGETLLGLLLSDAPEEELL